MATPDLSFLFASTATPIMYPERGEGIFALAIVLAVVGTIVLVLRLWSRALLPGDKFGVDDWMAVAAWPFVVAIHVVSCLFLRHGFGLHLLEVLLTAPGNITLCLKLLYASYMMYSFAIAFLRISAGLFYHRLFSGTSRTFRWVVHTSTVLNVIWLIGLNLTAIFQCHPISAFWDKTITDFTCIPNLNMQIGSSIPSVVLDLLVLLMPLPIILRLQMPMARKLMILAVFASGYSVVALSLGRLATVVSLGPDLSMDITWYSVKLLIWFNLELFVASLCVSLPAISTLVRRVRYGGMKALFSARDIRSLNSSGNARSKPQSIQLTAHSKSGLRTGTYPSSEALVEG